MQAQYIELHMRVGRLVYLGGLVTARLPLDPRFEGLCPVEDEDGF
jgi:hypothetical protein